MGKEKSIDEKIEKTRKGRPQAALFSFQVPVPKGWRKWLDIEIFRRYVHHSAYRNAILHCTREFAPFYVLRSGRISSGLNQGDHSLHGRTVAWRSADRAALSVVFIFIVAWYRAYAARYICQSSLVTEYRPLVLITGTTENSATVVVCAAGALFLFISWIG